MVTTKNNRVNHRTRTGGLGLLANGSAGSWEIAIDETTSGPDRWYAQIEGPTASFSFELPSLDIVEKMVRFLEASGKASASLTLSKDKKTPVALVKDDEYADRYFLVVGPIDDPVARFTLAGSDVVSLGKALQDVKEELTEG
jgi:hypothetical protein